MQKTLSGKNMLMIFSFLAVTSMSCSKDDNPVVPQPGNTVVDIVAGDTSFSLLKAAVDKAGVGDALKNTNNITVFAPDNAAFRASGITSVDGYTSAQLADILTYHVLTAKVMAADVPASDTVKTLQGKLIFASSNANGVFVNGVKVKTPNVAASNGIIHVISKVLIPPTQTIAELATATPSLSLLLQAVVKAGLADAVSAPGKYTVFAPVNDAFNSAGLTSTAIENTDAAAVGAIVTAHVLTTNAFASDLIDEATVPTLKANTTLTIGLNPPSVKITGSANAASVITVTDIVATNGVIHLIDKVLQ